MTLVKSVAPTRQFTRVTSSLFVADKVYREKHAEMLMMFIRCRKHANHRQVLINRGVTQWNNIDTYDR